MRVCLLGDFSENLDEGFKNSGHYLARWLQAAGDQVVRLNVKRIFGVEFWRRLRTASPQIIHTIAQPTHGSLIFTRLLRLFWPKARTLVSALRPESFFRDGQFSLTQRLLMRYARPDLFLAQSAQAASLFQELGCAVARLPAGVDLERFAPPTPDQKRTLRHQYGLRVDQPLVLHVGHLRDERNLATFSSLPAAGIQVVVVGSTYMRASIELVNRLEAAGIRVIKGYQPQVEEFYQLADCYGFPVLPSQSLSMPLSVLEAMACNLKIVTTRFPGLVDAFPPGDGLYYIDQPDGQTISTLTQAAIAACTPVATRRMAQPYSWQAITEKLRQYYRELVE